MHTGQKLILCYYIQLLEGVTIIGTHGAPNSMSTISNHEVRTGASFTVANCFKITEFIGNLQILQR